MTVGQPVLDTNYKHFKYINVNLDKSDNDNNDYNCSNEYSTEEELKIKLVNYKL